MAEAAVNRWRLSWPKPASSSKARFRLTGWVELPFMAGQETPEVTPEVQLLQIIRGAQSRVALQEALGLKDAEHFRQRYLLPVLNAGLIERTVPEKPNSRLQKYRLTDKGRARLVDPKPEATE